MAEVKSDQWREIAAQKEREWKDITEHRIETLEQACQEKDRQLTEERGKFLKLKEDFKYNLRLLEERDTELDRYDASFADLKAQLNTKNAEVSECKIAIDDLKTQLNCEGKSREELQLHYQARLREKQAEIDTYRSSKDGEVQEERKEYESFKRKLQRQLTELQEEMDAQKREITTEYEEAMRKREHEFRIQADEMSAKVLEYELKAKLLGKELELSRAAEQKVGQEYSEAEGGQRALEKALKQKEWELQDQRAMKDASISDLENQIHQKDLAAKRQDEEYKRKHAELDSYCREKEAALSAARESFAGRESELVGQVRELQSQLEDRAVEIRKLQWAAQDTEKEKTTAMKKLQEELHAMKERCDRQLSSVSRDQVGQNLEVQALRENEDKLRQEIIQKKEDIERYKKELASAIERESALERSKTQMELDWQRRHEGLERQTYEQSEDLVRKLTKARDEAQASVKQKSRELEQREKLIHVLQTVREQCLATLKQHDIQLDKNMQVEVERSAVVSREDYTSLEEQNASLKQVVREMRAQMEQLGTGVPTEREKMGTSGKVANDYVLDLEAECHKLRKHVRDLESDKDVAHRFGRIPAPLPSNQDEVMSEVKDNFLVKNHIQSLNDLIGSLRAEKVELSAQVKKQQANILYQEKTRENNNKLQRERQVEVEQLQYELGALTRRSQTELTSLRQKISDLELQLLEARKEADEYYRSNLERNMEATSLQQELSNLKLQLAEKRPSINYGAQELLIQQLQGEILSLKQHGAQFPGGGGSESGDSGAVGHSNQVHALHGKLKNAARKITELAREKQQLIEMGNKLRAELKRAGVENINIGPSGKHLPRPLMQSIRSGNVDHVTQQIKLMQMDSSNSKMTSDQVANKLNQLEKLQYELTRQELQYAQRFVGPKVENQPSMSDDDYKPPSILKKPSRLRESIDTEFDVRASVNTEGGETVYSIPGVEMSSVGGESLQEIWRMLDDGRPSPTPRLTAQDQRAMPTQASKESLLSDSRTSENEEQGDIYLSGRPTGQQRPRQEKKLSNKASGRVFKKVQNKPLVRNYNIKEDKNAR
ncbi:coiled-coil domain-containing protein 57-like isoform X1 [Mya arenaria]|uniref:coiled-coil domain-containing protein 57-like isoform X1 n=1 Tax=Mya arenaria TaxID=6604 RepID=UPI0022E95045|nr:coiled-coil domain-containing protein 57-like isoform X1 [Mya arenaria]